MLHAINSHVLTSTNPCINTAIHVLLMYGFAVLRISIRAVIKLTPSSITCTVAMTLIFLEAAFSKRSQVTCFSAPGFNTFLGAQQMLMHRQSCLIPVLHNKIISDSVVGVLNVFVFAFFSNLLLNKMKTRFSSVRFWFGGPCHQMLHKGRILITYLMKNIKVNFLSRFTSL